MWLEPSIQSAVPVLDCKPLTVRKLEALVLIVTLFEPFGVKETAPVVVKLFPVPKARLLLIVVVPLVAPRETVLAAPPMLSVVAVVLNKLPVVWLVAMVPELALIVPAAVTAPVVVRSPLFATVNLVTPEAEAVKISSFSV